MELSSNDNESTLKRIADDVDQRYARLKREKALQDTKHYEIYLKKKECSKIEEEIKAIRDAVVKRKEVIGKKEIQLMQQSKRNQEDKVRNEEQ